MKPIVIAFLSLGVAIATQAQVGESNEGAYKAYLGDQDVNIVKTMWKKVVADARIKHEQNPKDQNLFYDYAVTQFGLLTATMRDKDEDLFDDYADNTEENLEGLLDINKKWAEPRALLSAVYGLRMGYSPWKGMYLGSKSQSLMEKALADSPNSPLVWKLYGNSKFFTPETWGGDLKEAIKAYEKAIQLFESDLDKTKFNWFYLDTIAFLGQAYQKDGQTSKALATYEKAIKVEPNYNWVKFNLLPKAKKTASAK
jgi:tetratricopeptide (TPR) repeat protein